MNPFTSQINSRDPRLDSLFTCLECGDGEGDDGGPESDPDAPGEVGQDAVAELEERLVVQQHGARHARDDQRRPREQGEQQP